MTKPAAFSLGRNMDHPHLKSRFTLKIWVPVEQIPLLIGSNGDVVLEIKRETRVNFIEFPGVEPDSLWAPVVIVGDPTCVFRAYQAIASIVEEVDTVSVAEFPLYIRRHPIIVGPRGATLKRISAENAVRIFVPPLESGQQGWSPDASGGSNNRSSDKNTVIQLEGEVEPIFSALAMVIEAVYGFRPTTLVNQSSSVPVSMPAPSLVPPRSEGSGSAPSSPLIAPVAGGHLAAAATLPQPPQPPLSDSASTALGGATVAAVVGSAGAATAFVGATGGPNHVGSSQPHHQNPAPAAQQEVKRGNSKSTSSLGASVGAGSSVSGQAAKSKQPTRAESNKNLLPGTFSGAGSSNARTVPAAFVAPSAVSTVSGSSGVAGPGSAGAKGTATARGGKAGKTADRWSQGQESAQRDLHPPTHRGQGQGQEEKRSASARQAAGGVRLQVVVAAAAKATAATSSPQAMATAPTSVAPSQHQQVKGKGQQDQAGRGGGGGAARIVDGDKAALARRSKVETASLSSQNQQQQQRQGQQGVIPIPGPLPSTEKTEKEVNLSVPAVSVLQGLYGKKRLGGGGGSAAAAAAAVTTKDLEKWSILKDILKHTGTSAARVPLPVQPCTAISSRSSDRNSSKSGGGGGRGDSPAKTPTAPSASAPSASAPSASASAPSASASAPSGLAKASVSSGSAPSKGAKKMSMTSPVAAGGWGQAGEANGWGEQLKGERRGEGGPPVVVDNVGQDPRVVLLIKGPTNCVEVAVEALQRLGRGVTVRDTITFVKKNCPHRRLAQQRRKEQQQQQQAAAAAKNNGKNNNNSSNSSNSSVNSKSRSSSNTGTNNGNATSVNLTNANTTTATNNNTTATTTTKTTNNATNDTSRSSRVGPLPPQASTQQVASDYSATTPASNRPPLQPSLFMKATATATPVPPKYGDSNTNVATPQQENKDVAEGSQSRQGTGAGAGSSVGGKGAQGRREAAERVDGSGGSGGSGSGNNNTKPNNNNTGNNTSSSRNSSTYSSSSVGDRSATRQPTSQRERVYRNRRPAAPVASGGSGARDRAPQRSSMETGIGRGRGRGQGRGQGRGRGQSSADQRCEDNRYEPPHTRAAPSHEETGQHEQQRRQHQQQPQQGIGKTGPMTKAPLASKQSRPKRSGAPKGGAGAGTARGGAGPGESSGKVGGNGGVVRGERGGVESEGSRRGGTGNPATSS